MFAARVLKVISSKFKSDPAQPTGSFASQAGKKLVALTIAATAAFITGGYMVIHRVLETRKYVDVERMELYIPKDRNIFGHGAEMDVSQAGQVAKEALTVMVQIREQEEPQTDPEVRKHFSKEASAERRAILSTLLFGSHTEESTKIYLELLPYLYSPTEIALLKKAGAAKEKNA